MEAELIPEGIKISRKLRFDPSVWLLTIVQKPLLLSLSQKYKRETDRYEQIGNWSDFTYLLDQERMLNVGKKIEHNVVKNVKY
jgi:hypothetical protein